MTHLSPRQLDVLRLVAEGLTDPEIADRLRIGYGSVVSHKGAVFKKLEVHKAAHAVHVAYQRGLLGVAPVEDLEVLRSAREMGYRIALVRPEDPS